MSGHGGNLHELARLAGRRPEEILDFSASINPLGPPESLRGVIARTIDELVHYPEPGCAALAAAIAAKLGLSADRVAVGNGSTELLFAAAHGLDYVRAIVPVPSYLDYAAAVRQAGREVLEIPLDEAAGFQLDWDALDRRLVDGDLVILGQPNNPTGLLADADRVRDAAARHPGCRFVIDEAFAGFVESYRSPAESAPANVVVLRSLTKLYAIAGLRLGYAVARPEAIARIVSRILPWSVNTLAQAVGLALLDEDGYAGRTVRYVAAQRRDLAERLARLPGLYVYPGTANYLLVRIDRPDLDAPALAGRLLAEGIALRTFGPREHLDARFFRVAVRTEEENRRLEAAIREAISPGPGRVPCADGGPIRPAACGRSRAGGSCGAKRGPAGDARRTPALMFQGTSSNAGKSLLTAAICRILFQDGVRVAPFKAQNMSLNSFVTRDGGEMGRAQVVQAQACRLEPDVRMNPILLKPNSDTGCQVVVRGKPVGNMRVGQYNGYKPEAMAAACACYDALAAEFDAVVLEGAGSPGEVNLRSDDIVNMRMARYADAPVLIVGDIDRGGVFASFVGTMEVLLPWERRRVAGWVVNRFRGDAGLLGPALDYTLHHTGRPVLGVVPYLHDLNLPEEDSVEFRAAPPDRGPSREGTIELAIVDLPHLSNFTDFDAFRVEPDVRLRVVRSAADLNGPDAVLLGGSKTTLDDLAYLRQSGLAERIVDIARRGRAEVVGICGGFQMLGREIRDPLAVESAGSDPCGLGLLELKTVMAVEKTLIRTAARHAPSGLDVTGYEIHHGRTDPGQCQPLFARPDGQVVGAASRDGRVWGTYLHGVFDADPFRRWFLDRLRVRRGLAPIGQVVGRYDIEASLDRLAGVVRQALPVQEIYRLMGLR